jgi:hypothetical protein
VWQPEGKHGLLTASARTLMNWLRIFSLLLLPTFVWAQNYDPFSYRSGFSTIQALGRDIYNSLEPAERAMISAQPISLDTSRKPYIALLHFKDGSEAIRGVWISQGFIDLVNQLAHAKAIDRKRKGYFATYLQTLSRSEESVPSLPEIGNSAYWTDAVLNDQLSNFNSIIGIVVGIHLAQHYLGLYEKYEHRLKASEGEGASLNNLLTPEEWEQSYRRGLSNAMLASCMTEGFLPLCEGLSLMKQRPTWVAYFLPEGTQFKAMRTDMVKLQHKFLND